MHTVVRVAIRRAWPYLSYFDERSDLINVTYTLLDTTCNFGNTFFYYMASQNLSVSRKNLDLWVYGGTNNFEKNLVSPYIHGSGGSGPNLGFLGFLHE